MNAALSWPVSTEVHVGPLMLRPHGILIAVAIVAGALLMRRFTRRAGVADDAFWRVLWWAVLAGLVGMRLAWVAGRLSEIQTPIEIVAIWRGGMSLFGGLFAAVAVGAFVARREGLSALVLLDAAAPGLALAIAIGRVSDLLIGDHLGTPTTMPWGFRYPGSDHPLAGSPPVGAVVHPVALYDVVSTALLLVVLLWFVRSARSRGSAIALFTLWYASFRLVTDELRTDPERLWGLTGSQLAATALIAVTVGALVLRRRRDLDVPVPAGAAGS